MEIDKEIFNTIAELVNKNENGRLSRPDLIGELYDYAKQLQLNGVVGQSKLSVCQCGEKPKDVPDDGYEYICNKCRKPFAN